MYIVKAVALWFALAVMALGWLVFALIFFIPWLIQGLLFFWYFTLGERYVRWRPTIVEP